MNYSLNLVFAQAQGSSSWSNIIDELARTPLSKVITFVFICSLVRVGLWLWLTRVPLHLRGAAYKTGSFFNEALDAIIYAGVFVFLLIRPFAVQAFQIPSESMENTILTGDYIVGNKAIYRYTDPKVGDIVLFEPPAWACQPNQLDADGQVNVDFIKRCVGVPGDVVEVRHGTLYRNGVAVPEPFLKENMSTDSDFKLVKYHPAPGVPTSWAQSIYWPIRFMSNSLIQDVSETAAPYRLNSPAEAKYVHDLPPAPIPKGYYLFMGDNRNNSDDGRAWGLVARDRIIGRSEFIWFPLNRMRVTR